jgi:hypothetical protein
MIDLRKSFLTLVCVILISACANLGLEAPRNFDDQWEYAQRQSIALRRASTQALAAHAITSEDMEWCIGTADRGDQMLDMARAAQAEGDINTAQGRLQLATAVLTELQQTLTKRAQQ